MVVFYIFVSVIGALGNGLVLFTVLSRPKMRMMRHVFISNLAVSDFILCAITTPFTLVGDDGFIYARPTWARAEGLRVERSHARKSCFAKSSLDDPRGWHALKTTRKLDKPGNE